MKKILIISYYFPPLGMGGVQRAAKFARYLPEFGWQPVVLTVKDLFYYAYDYSLLEELKDCRIIRTGSLDPLRILKIFGKCGGYLSTKNNQKNGNKNSLLNIPERWLFIPDSKRLWLPFAKNTAARLIKKENIKLVFTTSPPNSSHLAGYYLKRKYGVKWIADFRDFWTPELQSDYPTGIHRSINQRLEKKVVKSADAVVSVTEGIDSHNKKLALHNKNCIITNGLDRNDLPETGTEKKSKFIIGYMGAWNKLLDPVPFLRGFKKAAEKIPELIQNSEIRMIGRSLINESDLKTEFPDIHGLIKYYGYLEHKEALKNLSESNVLLFILSENISSSMMTGKIFEYLAFLKPVLAVTPECEAAGLLREWGDCYISNPDKEDFTAENIIQIFKRWKNDREINSRNEYNNDFIDKFDRKQLTKKLSDICNELI